MGGGLMQLVNMAHRMFTLQVTHKLLSSRSYTEDTPTSQWNALNRL